MADDSLLKAETISALNETLKILIGALGAAATWVTVISKKTSNAASANEKVTAENTLAINRLIKDLESHSVSMKQHKDDVDRQNREIKVVVAKVKTTVDEHLTMFPKLQAEIEALTKRMLDEEFKNSQRDEQLERFIKGMNALIERKGKL
jgi:hypothetical protein